MHVVCALKLRATKIEFTRMCYICIIRSYLYYKCLVNTTYKIIMLQVQHQYFVVRIFRGYPKIINSHPFKCTTIHTNKYAHTDIIHSSYSYLLTFHIIVQRLIKPTGPQKTVTPVTFPIAMYMIT